MAHLLKVSQGIKQCKITETAARMWRAVAIGAAKRLVRVGTMTGQGAVRGVPARGCGATGMDAGHGPSPLSGGTAGRLPGTLGTLIGGAVLCMECRL